MKDKKDIRHSSDQKSAYETNPEGYPLYPASDDIYLKGIIAGDLDPEEISKTKSANEKEQLDNNNEKGFDTNVSGSDLDIPGAELDDRLEDICSEDEENNYYSLGGDNHNDLEEDKGD